MSVSNSQAFPFNSDWRNELGMTYREWLIGQALCGFAATGGHEEVHEIINDVFLTVDTIIKKLDRES